MSEPFSTTGGMSVTIKGDEPGGKFNDPKSPGTWLVFHGTVTQIRTQIIEAFGMDKSAETLSVLDLQNEATSMFKAVNKVGSQLGGTALKAGDVTWAKPAAKAAPAKKAKPKPEVEADGDVFEQAANAEATPAKEKGEDDVDPILAALENCKTVADVQQIWAENQSAFSSNRDYMTAYKTRGKALS